MNVSQGSKNVSQKMNGGKKMKKNEKMSIAINQFILDNDFLMRFIVDNVKDKIYDEKTYNDGFIENVIINDLDNGYSSSYILDYIIDEIDIYDLVYEIDSRYRDDFNELVEQCNNRY